MNERKYGADGMCNDQERCGSAINDIEDTYCTDCPNKDESPAQHAKRVIADGHARGVLKQLPPEPEGMKFDTEKPRFDLLFADMPLALEAVARVLTFGAAKYADGNWTHIENAQRRYLAAGIRHELALAKGEEQDNETGEHHLAHKLCCDLFRLELALRESGQ